MNRNMIATLFMGTIFLFLFGQTGLLFAEKSVSGLEWNVVRELKLPQQPKTFVHSLDGKLVFILTQNNSVLVYNQQGKLKGTLPVEKDVIDINITPRGDVLFLINEKKNTYSTVTIDFIREISIGDSPYLGMENAPIIVTVFTDFQCPYCAKVVPILEQVLEHNPDTVKIVLKNLPLTSIHDFAEKAALAALAAGEQGKFWQFHDELFDSPEINDEVIGKIADELGLDQKKFKNDMNSNKIRKKLMQDLQAAQKANVGATPTIFVNGRKVKTRGLDAMQSMINQELEKIKSGNK